MTAPILTDIKVITFDLDDTLWDCAPAIENAEKALYAWHEQVTPAVVEAHDAASLQAYRVQMREQFPELQGCVTASRLAALRQLLTDCGYPEGLAEEGFAVFYKARSEVQLYEGAITLLAALQKKFRLAAITNGNADLRSIGVDEYFEYSYAADLTKLAKPAPDMFERCMKDMNVKCNELLHIGDNPVTDVGGGHNAFVQTLWYNPYNSEWPVNVEKPHYQASFLSDIGSLLLGSKI